MLHAMIRSTTSLFHLAFHVRDLDVARRFYGQVLGCTEGRSTATWVDFDLHGHQLSLHLGEPFATAATGSARATSIAANQLLHRFMPASSPIAAKRWTVRDGSA